MPIATSGRYFLGLPSGKVDGETFGVAHGPATDFGKQPDLSTGAWVAVGLHDICS